MAVLACELLRMTSISLGMAGVAWEKGIGRRYRDLIWIPANDTRCRESQSHFWTASMRGFLVSNFSIRTSVYPSDATALSNRYQDPKYFRRLRRHRIPHILFTPRQVHFKAC